MNRRILFFVSEDWYFYSHRLSLARAARDAGFDVMVVSNIKDHGDLIRKEGFRLLALDIKRNRMNPFSDAWVIVQLLLTYRRYRPTIVHHVALKPVLFGVIAARLARVPCVVNTIAGMGHLFSNHVTGIYKFAIPMVRFFMRSMLRHERSRVIVQNQFDYKVMEKEMQLKPSAIALIKGSGVDIREFRPSAEPDGPIRITLVSRMLWEKGIGEFVAAAAILRERRVPCVMTLVGSPDKRNRSTVSDEKLREWAQSGVVEWWGQRNDIANVWAQSHIGCLPSYYREGLPKCLLEAAACGRPMVSSDMPGCLELVEDGKNGIVVPSKNGGLLADAIQKLVYDPALRKRMGEEGRRSVEKNFSEEIILGQTLHLYESLLHRYAPS